MLSGKAGLNQDLFVDAATAKSLIEDGKGWTRHDRTSFYDSLSEEELLARLESWLPVVRQRAAEALARKPRPPMRDLLKKPGTSRLETRYGACQAFAKLRTKSSPALPDMLGRMARNGPGKEDPRGMEQRYLSFDIFGTMLAKHSLKDVDRNLLRQAIAAGLANEDGKARTAISGIYRKLSLEELRPILPEIHAAIVEPAPSGIMFRPGCGSLF